VGREATLQIFSQTMSTSMKLSKTHVKNLEALLLKYDKSMVMNVAVLLVGGRPACFADLETNAFTALVAKTFSEIDVLELNKGNVPLLYRKNAVSKEDLEIILTTSVMEKRNMVSMRRVLGYTGTGFPCSKFKDTILISWNLVDDKNNHIILANHCAKSNELKACFEDFKKIRERASGLIGMKIGKVLISQMVMVAVPFDWEGV
jgi:hypothetical protein